MTTPPGAATTTDFGPLLEAARVEAGLSPRQLAKKSGVAQRRVADLERGADVPSEQEIGVLAQACQVSVFALVPPGYSLRVLDHDGSSSGPRVIVGSDAFDALLREYLSMVVELRSGRAIAPPTLRHDDLVELAAALGDTPDAIEARLLQLLGTDAAQAHATRSMILPSSDET